MLKVTTVVLDSRRLFREGLKNILASSSFEVVGEFDDLPALKSAGPAPVPIELVLFDLPAEADAAVSAVADMRAAFGDAKLVALTGQADPDFVAKVMDAGADGYVLKDISPDDLFSALTDVISGTAVVPASVASEPAESVLAARDCLPALRYEELDVEARVQLDRSNPEKNNREVALELCRELGHFDAVRTCRRNRWYDLLAAIQANRNEALALPFTAAAGGERPSA